MKTNSLLMIILSVFILVTSPAHADEKWGTRRPSTQQEQAEVNAYRNKTLPWVLQLDFHDKAAAQAIFEPVIDDLAWLKSCRQSGNDVINGALRLQTKIADHCHAKWSTGYVVSKNWHQLYGYFEARMRITKKDGINNAFWLTGKDLEIDIVEAHFPKYIHYAVHDWGNPHRGQGCGYAANNIAYQMNDYGLLWLPDRLIYTFNGKATCTMDVKTMAVPAEIRFSTAVADFAGKTQDPTNAEMDVYWVHAASLRK